MTAIAIEECAGIVYDTEVLRASVTNKFIVQIVIALLTVKTPLILGKIGDEKIVSWLCSQGFRSD
nr:hypothetical protein [Bacillus cereus group sp. BfR-BA-01331]